MNKKTKTLLIHSGLFILTLLTTTLAGLEWTVSKFLILGITWDEFLSGFHFSIPFLTILTFHEFGHYFTARYHRIKVTLPYYIPLWFGFIGAPSLGTMGAFIRIKEHIQSRTKYFDVGVSGPVAGFVVAIVCFVLGFKTLPETEYIYEIHPEYELFGADFDTRMMGLDTVILKKDLNPLRMNFQSLPDSIRTNSGSVSFGDNILMNLGRKYLAPTDRYVPSSNELMHYPLLLASFLAFFFTALNLLPIGQLDGGHIIFGLFGSKNHAVISRVMLTLFLFYAGLGVFTFSDLRSVINGEFSSITSDNLFVKVLYCLSTFFATKSIFSELRNRWLLVVVLFTCQLFLHLFTGWVGYSGWLVFALIIGRFIGVDHPLVVEDRPLSLGRKVLGWLALIIFILSFSPQPLVVHGL